MNENSQIGSERNEAFEALLASPDGIVSSTPTKTKPPIVTDSSESGFEEGVPDKSKTTSASESFIPGSQFFSNFRTPQNPTYSSTSDYFTDFTGTDTPSKLRESTRRLSIRKPFNPYIAYSSDEELEEWMKNPKTDYTYSASLTYRKRVTPERKVGSPNMSRKGLRGNIDYNQSSDFSDHSFSIDAKSYDRTYQNYRSSGLPMDALSDSESESPPVALRTRNSRSRSIDHRPNSNGSIITTVTKSNYTTTKKTYLQGGLDEQSGEESQEEIVPLPSLRFRTGTPLTASRGGTPLIASRGGTPLARRSCTPLYTSLTKETNTKHTNTLTSTPEEEEEKTLYRKIASIPSAACRTVALSSKWVFSYIVTTVILMATKTTTYFSSTKNSSTASADKLSSLTDSNSSHISSSTKSESAFDRFMTTVTTIITTITTTTTTEEITESTSGSLESVTTKVKRRPRLLFWIPLLLLLLLLAYWWLFLAPATSEDEGETQSLGYLASLPFIKLYDLSSWLALGAYDGLLFAATKFYELTLWLTFGTYNRIVWFASSSPEALITASSNTYNTLTSVLTTSFNSTSKSLIALKDNAYFYSSEALTGFWFGTKDAFNYLWLSSFSIMNWFWLGTQSALNYLWLSSISILNGCWSFILTCLTYLLDLFYLLYSTLQGIGLSLYGILLSSVSVFSTPPLSSESSNETLTEAPNTLGNGYENDGTSWPSLAKLTHSSSEIMIGITEGLSEAAGTSHNWIWSSWLGIIGSVGEGLSDASSYTISTLKSASSSSLGFLDTFWEFTSLGFLSMWSLLVYLWTGLWSGLVYLLTSLWAFLTSFAFTLGEFASGTATAVTNTIGLISLPSIGYFKSTSETPPPVVIPASDSKIAAPQVAIESMVEEIVDKVLGSRRLQDNLQQLIDTHNKEEDVSALMRSVIEQEVNLVRAEATVMKEEVASIKSDSAQILGLKEQQTTLVNQLNMLAAAVENTSENVDKQQQFNDQLNGLRDQIDLLSQKLQNLQESHTNLESEVSTCCKKASLTLEDVERHVTTLLGDILGFSGGDNTTGESGATPPKATASDLNAWLKSYFVAKHELEARLTALADSLEKAAPINVDLPKETMEQTTQMVMETVMDKIRDEIRIQQDHFSSKTMESLSEQVKAHVQEQLEENVKVQVEAAAGKLKGQIALDVQEHVKVSSKEMGSSLTAEVNSLISESVSREVSAAVPLAVSSAVPDAVASQVNGIVEQAVSNKVDGVVENVVASQVNGVVEKFVISQVDGIVEKAVANQVDGVVEKVVVRQVDGVIQNVITNQVDEVVEKAVISQINGAVEKAVNSQVNGVIEEVVTSQVDSVIENAVTSQVNGVVEKEVAKQIDGAVEIAVTSQMNGVIEKRIDETVESSVKTLVSEEISSVLTDSVNAAVDDAISSNLPDAVAATLPGMVDVAVTSTINETVKNAAVVAVAGAVQGMPQLNMNEKEANEDGVKMTANISYLTHSNGGNSSFGVLTASGLDEKDVQRIVKEALNMYDADKTGMVDHALESAGGNIISTRCTEGYQVHMAEVSILGWPIYRYSINNPRTIIQPDVMPGQCWAFKGSQGYIVIQLAGPVRPTGFTMEHIPKTLSPSGSIDSAPREFSVWGLVSENGEEIELGSYEFVHDGDSLQYFSVKDGTIPNDMYFPIVELKIKSNHGNMKYTCLYRFRVHGVRYF